MIYYDKCARRVLFRSKLSIIRIFDIKEIGAMIKINNTTEIKYNCNFKASNFLRYKINELVSKIDFLNENMHFYYLSFF